MEPCRAGYSWLEAVEVAVGDSSLGSAAEVAAGEVCTPASSPWVGDLADIASLAGIRMVFDSSKRRDWEPWVADPQGDPQYLLLVAEKVTAGLQISEDMASQCLGRV